MTTRKKRLQITIEPELEPILERLSVLMERPKATLVTELLMSSLNTLTQTVEVLERAKQAKDGLIGIDDFRRKLISDAHSQIDILSGEMEGKSE